MQVKWLGAYDLCLFDVSASLLSPRGQVATLALVNMQPGCQLAKPAATQRWHHRRPWWLAANANTKMFLVFSFSLSFFLLTTWWSFVCGRQLLLLRPPFLTIVTAHIPLPHLVELLSQLVLPLRELLWTLFAFSRVFSKSIDFGFAFFYFLSRKITRKSYANILFAFFTWYLTCYRFSWFSFSLLCPAFVWRFVFVSISDSWRIYGFVAACFSFSFLLRVCGRGTVNGSDFNEFYWLNPYPNEVYIFSCAPAVIYQVEG